MPKRPNARKTLKNGLVLEARKDFYTGLWGIFYEHSLGPRWAGPFRTKREALERMNEAK